MKNKDKKAKAKKKKKKFDFQKCECFPNFSLLPECLPQILNTESVSKLGKIINLHQVLGITQKEF